MEDIELPEVSLGIEVVDRNERSLGRVTAVHPGYVVVERGRLFRTVLYIPREALAVERNRARVGITREEALDLGWQWEPGTIPYGTDPPPHVPIPPPPAGAPGEVGPGQ